MFTQGLQGDHPRYVCVNAGCKHFDAYGGPENIPVKKMSFNAKVPKFKMCGNNCGERN